MDFTQEQAEKIAYVNIEKILKFKNHNRNKFLGRENGIFKELTLIYIARRKYLMKHSLNQVENLVENFIEVSSIIFLGGGNHSEAFCINDQMVIKLPKHRKASDCLKTEIRVLRGLEGKTRLAIPNVLFHGVFPSGNQEFTYFVSKRLQGKKLSRAEFLKLNHQTTVLNAQRIAQFLYELHQEKQILPIKRKDLCLLHGDFSLNHVLFNEENTVCGILDFGDSRIGKAKSDFVYLLDPEDDEEFGVEFGEMVRSNYKKYTLGEMI